MDYETLIGAARDIGADHGKNAAAFAEQCLIGGRVTDGSELETAARIIRGLDDGDPAVYDELPEPDLSGQWADGYLPRDLAGDVGLDMDAAAADEILQDLCDAYCEAFRDAAEAETYRYCKALLS